MTGIKNLFVYGTLMSGDVMQAVTGLYFTGTHCRLDNFQRFSVKNADYPGIRHKHGKSVDGLIYLNIPDNIWPLLDEFEGDIYERIEVAVKTAENIEFSAFTYVIKEHSAHLLTDLPWSFDIFIQQRKKQFLREEM